MLTVNFDVLPTAGAVKADGTNGRHVKTGEKDSEVSGRDKLEMHVVTAVNFEAWMTTHSNEDAESYGYTA